jgi:hypothetical protein
LNHAPVWKPSLWHALLLKSTIAPTIRRVHKR